MAQGAPAAGKNRGDYFMDVTESIRKAVARGFIVDLPSGRIRKPDGTWWFGGTTEDRSVLVGKHLYMDATTLPTCPYCGTRHDHPEELDFGGRGEKEPETYCMDCGFSYLTIVEYHDGKTLYSTRKAAG